MLKTGLFLLLAVAAVISSTAQTNISVYRNDGQFNQIKLNDGSKINHSFAEATPQIEITDWLTGTTTVPFGAIDSCVVQQRDIPVVRIALTDFPDAEMLWEKEVYMNATLSIEGNGYCEDFGETALQIRGRGNTTWSMPKKPMRLKFAKKTALAGLKKAKNFVLLNNYLDQSQMRSSLSMWLARRLEVPYANSMVPCNVFFNNRYIGAYTLTEKVGINSGSVDIDEKVGMLFELDTQFDEKYCFHSALTELPVMVKDPDFDELYEDDPEGLTPDERLALWQDDFNRAEALALIGKGAEAFDIESLVNYMLLYHVVSNDELGHPKSLYIHKKSLDEGEKYIFGPAWDFDVAFNFYTPAEDGYDIRPPEKDNLTPYLIDCLLETSEAKALYAERWHTFKYEIYPEMMEFFEDYASLIAPSAKLNGLRWPSIGNFYGWAYHISSFDFHNHVAELRNWLKSRMNYLDQKNTPPTD